jgi:hypothetical protein
MEYPLVPDLSVVGFKTPALPARLASTWEVLHMLKITDPNAKAAYMIYPTIETTTSMKNWLSYRALPSNSTCTACNIQDHFKISNAFVQKQTQYYCPQRSEDVVMWETRTGQSKATDATYDDSTYNRLHKFNNTNEHPETCRASRIPSMFLAHIATNIYTLFSSHNSVILLLYTATVNALFSGAIPLYTWYTYRVGDASLDDVKKRELHGMFSVLFCILIPLSVTPIIIDYYRRNDQVTVDKTEEQGNRAIGSYILGAWTLLFSFVYIAIFPSLRVKWLSWMTEQDVESAQLQDAPQKNSDLKTANATPSTPQHNALDCLATNQPLITFAYWNLLQTPCLVMIVLITNSYGIDLYMQFVIFGSLAIGLLDVVNARVTMIIRIVYKLKPDDNSQFMVRVLVAVAFLWQHLVIAVAVYMKLGHMNVSSEKIFFVFVLFTWQTFQNIFLMIWESMSQDGPINTKQDEPKTSMPDYTKYDISCVFHEAMSTIVFLIFFFDSR